MSKAYTLRPGSNPEPKGFMGFASGCRNGRRLLSRRPGANPHATFRLGVCATECGLGSVVRVRASKARPAPPWFDATRGFGATLLARIRAVPTESHSVAQAPSPDYS